MEPRANTTIRPQEYMKYVINAMEMEEYHRDKMVERACEGVLERRLGSGFSKTEQGRRELEACTIMAKRHNSKMDERAEDAERKGDDTVTGDYHGDWA